MTAKCTLLESLTDFTQVKLTNKNAGPNFKQIMFKRHSKVVMHYNERKHLLQ
jgi:hypothetical protein